VSSDLNEDLGQSKDVGVEVEADSSRVSPRHHAARADVLQASAERTSSTSRSKASATSVTSSPDSTCSQSASVLIPLIAGLPKRTSGAMRTGEWGLAGLDALSPGDRAPTSGFEPDHRTVILVPVGAAIEPPVRRGLRHRQETGNLGL
jgi:hypothetical protein